MSLIRYATSASLQVALDLRAARQELLTSNLANVDTPGYQPRDLEGEGVLREGVAADGARANTLDRRDPRHLPEPPVEMRATRDEVVERPDATNTLDDNGVDLDKEMARLADNALRYTATVEMLRRRHATLGGVIQTMTDRG